MVSCQSDESFNVPAAGPNADEVRTGDYSAAGWAGGAPNGGGNIDNKNMVTPLEGLKLAFPQAEVTWSVGTGINGYDGPILGPHATVQVGQPF